MKRILFTSLSLVLVIVLFSCSDDNLPENDIPENKTELCIKSVALPEDMQYNGKEIISEFQHEDSIGIFLYGYHSGMPFLYATNEYNWWRLSKPVFLSNYPVRLFAYYPYKHDKHQFLIDNKVDVEHVTQTDYLYGYDLEHYVNLEKPVVDIRMKHLFALIQFKFIRNGYPHDCTIQKISIRNAEGVYHMYSRGKLNLENGNLIPGQGYYEEASTKSDDMNFFNPDMNEKDYPRILVFPTEPTLTDRDLMIEFVIDGRKYRHYVKKGTAWQGGNKYTYEVKMYPVNKSVKSTDDYGDISVQLIQITESV